MASVYITLGQSGQPGPYGSAPVFRGAVRSEVITSSGTSAAGALTAQNSETAQIFCASAVYARAGATVTPATGLYCPAGIVSYLAPLPGQAINVIDV